MMLDGVNGYLGQTVHQISESFAFYSSALALVSNLQRLSLAE